jgi:hypothetical protein
MLTRLTTRLALATVAAVGLYTATLGLPVAGPCDGVAGAAPSPTCGSDLRECLRLNAKTDIYGARYVAADDVARCVEAFNACIHGGASAGGNANPPPSTQAGGTRKGLPSRFGIKTQFGTYDCTRSGDALKCAVTGENLPAGEDSLTLTVTGSLSGLTMTGTATGHQTGHAPANPSCRYEQDMSGPASYVFNLDGTVAMREGPFQINAVGSGSCLSTSSFTGDVSNQTATWSAIQ